MLRASLALAVVPFLLVACGGEPANQTQKPRIAVVPKGATHLFWKAVGAGAKASGERTGLDVVWKAPLQENDRAQQIQLVQQLVGDGIQGLALAPLDHAALVPVVADCKRRDIPVVIFDSDLDGTPGTDFASFVATDNEAAGKLAGEHLAARIGGAGKKVVLLRYLVGSASTEARERGFLAAAKASGLEVLVDNRYAGPTIGEAKTQALQLADRLREAAGVFCSNESATVGMLQALEQLGLHGKVTLVGFDSSPPLVDGLRAGTIDALVVQDPTRMGELAVQCLADLLAKKPVAPRIDTGARVATKANMQEPDVERLLR